MIEPTHKKISIRRQCALLGLNRSSYYYHPRSVDCFSNNMSVQLINPVTDTEENLDYMKRIDQLYMKWPFYGSRRMTTVLKREGYPVNRKRIQRLMRLMGIQAIYPKPRLSMSHQDHKIYPYLLRDISIDRPGQVWCADITYLPLHYGFVYLVAILDWYSRYVLAWRLSNTLDTIFCLEALDEALKTRQPEIFNSDQGCQFTSTAFTDRLKEAGIKISMDGRGRVFDNIFIERLWRSLKYEDVYLKDYQTVMELNAGLDDYFRFYNHERPHQSLENKTPAMVYHGYEYKKTA
jgi:putative transposase